MTTETINKLAGRDDLNQSEVLQLAEARRTNRGEETRFLVCGWQVSVTHHIHTGGHWSASAWHANSSEYSGSRSLSGNDDESTCWKKVAAFIAFAAENPRK